MVVGQLPVVQFVLQAEPTNATGYGYAWQNALP